MVKNLPSAVKYRTFLLGRVHNDVGNDGGHGEVIDSDGVSLQEDDGIICQSNHCEISSASLLNKDKKSAEKKLKLRGVVTPCSNAGKGKVVLDRTRLLARTEDSSSSELEKKSLEPSDQFGGRSNRKSLVGSSYSTSCVDVICISDDDD